MKITDLEKNVNVLKEEIKVKKRLIVNLIEEQKKDILDLIAKEKKAIGKYKLIINNQKQKITSLNNLKKKLK